MRYRAGACSSKSWSGLRLRQDTASMEPTPTARRPSHRPWRTFLKPQGTFHRKAQVEFEFALVKPLSQCAWLSSTSFVTNVSYMFSFDSRAHLFNDCTDSMRHDDLPGQCASHTQGPDMPQLHDNPGRRFPEPAEFVPQVQRCDVWQLTIANSESSASSCRMTLIL